MSSEWLKYRSQVTGKSIEELRKEMAERGSKANKSQGAKTRWAKKHEARNKRNSSVKEEL